jgi:hypothetical protein
MRQAPSGPGKLPEAPSRGICVTTGSGRVQSIMQGVVHDVLTQAAGGARIAEIDGVRWTSLLYPEDISVPGYAVATILLQNASDHARTAVLKLSRSKLVAEPLEIPVPLNPGEAGMIRVPLFLPRTLPRGTYELEVKVELRMPQEFGRRILSVAPSSAAPPRPSLKVSSAHDLPPVNLFAYDWTGFVSLYLPPQTAADLELFRMVQELASRPWEPGTEGDGPRP